MSDKTKKQKQQLDKELKQAFKTGKELAYTERDEIKSAYGRAIAEANTKIEHLKMRASEAKDDAAVKYRDTIAELEKKRDQMKAKQAEISKAGKEKLDSLRNGLANVLSSVSDGAESLAEKLTP